MFNRCCLKTLEDSNPQSHSARKPCGFDLWQGRSYGAPCMFILWDLRNFSLAGFTCSRLLFRACSDLSFSKCLGSFSPVGWAMENLAVDWEHRAVVRARFRREISWLQFPIPPAASTKTDNHAPTTRALELNVEILSCLLDRASFEFLDIERLQMQACDNVGKQLYTNRIVTCIWTALQG